MIRLVLSPIDIPVIGWNAFVAIFILLESKTFHTPFSGNLILRDMPSYETPPEPPDRPNTSPIPGFDLQRLVASLVDHPLSLRDRARENMMLSEIARCVTYCDFVGIGKLFYTLQAYIDELFLGGDVEGAFHVGKCFTEVVQSLVHLFDAQAGGEDL